MGLVLGGSCLLEGSCLLAGSCLLEDLCLLEVLCLLEDLSMACALGPGPGRARAGVVCFCFCIFGVKAVLPNFHFSLDFDQTTASTSSGPKFPAKWRVSHFLGLI